MEYNINETINTCVICYCNNTKIITTKCGHSYCTACFLTWYFNKFELKQECCYCRQELNIEDYINDYFSEIKEYYTLKQIIKSKSFYKIHKLQLKFLTKALIPACYYNDLDLVCNILESIDLDVPDILLYFACISGKQEVLYYFIDFRGSDFNKNLIIKLLSSGHFQVVEFIYNSTSKVADIYDIIRYFLEKNEIKIVKFLLNNKIITSDLSIDDDLVELCVIHSNLEILKEFEKIDSSLIDETVIYTASAYDKDEILSYALNKKNIMYSIHDTYLLAIESKCYKSLECLLVNRKSDYEFFLANKLCDKYNIKSVKAFISQFNNS